MFTQNGGAPADDGALPQDTGAAPNDDAGASAASADDVGDQDDGEGRQQPSAEERYSNIQKALRQERLERRAERDRFESQINELRGQNQPRKKPAAQDSDDEDVDLPDESLLDKDPRNAVLQLMKVVGRYRKQLAADAEANEKSSKREQFIQSTQTYMKQAEDQFTEDHPDYRDAVKHFKQTMREDFEDQGLKGEKLKDAMNNELLRLVHNARTNGTDPAELVYKRAVKRGYRSKQADAELDKVERGQKSGPDIPRGGGSRKGVTNGTLLKSDGKDFDKAWAEYEKQQTGR